MARFDYRAIFLARFGATLNGDLLVLIPKGMGLNKLGELVKTPKKGLASQYSNFGASSQAAHGDTVVAASYWVAITPTVFEGSSNKDFEQQQEVIAAYNRQHGTEYHTPNALPV